MAATLTWPQAKVKITEAAGKTVEYDKARLVVRAGAAHLFDNNGMLLARGELTDATKTQSAAELTFSDGSTWSAEKARGCGCGG